MFVFCVWVPTHWTNRLSWKPGLQYVLKITVDTIESMITRKSQVEIDLCETLILLVLWKWQCSHQFLQLSHEFSWLYVRMVSKARGEMYVCDKLTIQCSVSLSWSYAAIYFNLLNYFLRNIFQIYIFDIMPRLIRFISCLQPLVSVHYSMFWESI